MRRFENSSGTILKKEAEKSRSNGPPLRRCISPVEKPSSRNTVALLYDLFTNVSQSGGRPSLYAYSHVLNACSRTGQAQRALGALAEMRARGLALDQHNYCFAITACGRGGAPLEAAALFRQLKASGARPNEIAYNAAVGACADVAPVRALLGEASPLLASQPAPCFSRNS